MNPETTDELKSCTAEFANPFSLYSHSTWSLKHFSSSVEKGKERMNRRLWQTSPYPCSAISWNSVGPLIQFSGFLSFTYCFSVSLIDFTSNTVTRVPVMLLRWQSLLYWAVCGWKWDQREWTGKGHGKCQATYHSQIPVCGEEAVATTDTSPGSLRGNLISTFGLLLTPWPPSLWDAGNTANGAR